MLEIKIKIIGNKPHLRLVDGQRLVRKLGVLIPSTPAVKFFCDAKKEKLSMTQGKGDLPKDTILDKKRILDFMNPGIEYSVLSLRNKIKKSKGEK